MNLLIKRTGLFFFLFLTAATIFAQGTNQTYLEYIEKYKETAISEMSRTGIPASIKLAQAILESNAGTSTLARKAKNHFGIKCGPKWHGKKYHMEDDDFDEYGKKIKSCFRVYKNPVSSFIAHSEFLRDPRKSYRYGPLFELDPYDYQAWAFGLKKAGYATSPRYPQMLIKLIEDYDLTQFDRVDDIVYVEDDNEQPSHSGSNKKIFGRVGKINDLKVFIAKGGETIYQIAFQNNVKIKRLVKYNAAVTDGDNKVPEGYKVYLQPKRNNWRGKAAFHYVKKGETLFDISQKYGVKLRKLKRKNRLPDNAQPLVGERIRIRGWHRRNEVVKYKISGDGEIPPLNKKIENEGKKRASQHPEDSDLLDIEISPADEDKDEVLIDVDPVVTNPNSDLDENKPNDGHIVVDDDAKDESSVDDPVINDAPVIVDDTPVDDTPVKIGDAPVTVDDTPVDSTPVVKEPTYITIIKGDTLYSLARAFGLTVAELKALNGLTSNTLKIGQRLRVSK